MNKKNNNCEMNIRWIRRIVIMKGIYKMIKKNNNDEMNIRWIRIIIIMKWI